MNEEIKKTIEHLRTGGTILCPTDTIWGIACDATNENAVEKSYSIKKRYQSKSLIVLVNNLKMLQHYVKEIPSVAYDIIQVSTKPITIIYEQAIHLAENIIAEDGSIGIRIVKDDFCEKLISDFGKPIISTSANISGEPSPQNFSEISEKIKNAVDYIVDRRQQERNKFQSSSIIKLKTNGEFRIIRIDDSYRS